MYRFVRGNKIAYVYTWLLHVLTGRVRFQVGKEYKNNHADVYRSNKVSKSKLLCYCTATLIIALFAVKISINKLNYLGNSKLRIYGG